MGLTTVLVCGVFCMLKIRMVPLSVFVLCYINKLEGSLSNSLHCVCLSFLGGMVSVKEGEMILFLSFSLPGPGDTCFSPQTAAAPWLAAPISWAEV